MEEWIGIWRGYFERELTRLNHLYAGQWNRPPDDMLREWAARKADAMLAEEKKRFPTKPGKGSDA